MSNKAPTTTEPSSPPPPDHPLAGDVVVVVRDPCEHGPRRGDVFWLDEDVAAGDRTVDLFMISESGNSAGGVSYPLDRFLGVPSVGGTGGGLVLRYRYAPADSAPASPTRRTVTILGDG